MAKRVTNGRLRPSLNALKKIDIALVGGCK